MTGWEPDVLPGYWHRTIALGADPDGEGDIVATLVRPGTPEEAGAPIQRGTGRAVLALHGFTDYFFNTDLADHFVAAGFAFYAIDLHKCGRSWREGHTPHFTTDLGRYDAELELALGIIAAESGSPMMLIYGHSTGGLIAPLWLDRLRTRGDLARRDITGLVLNSPFLDLHGPAILRTAGTAGIRAVSSVRKRRVVRPPGVGTYGASLHRDYGGEFDYNLQWKPITGFPVTFGWINAIRRGHARLHRGLDVGVPNLVLRSDHSVEESADQETAQRGDAVLNVRQIARWSGCIGDRTTVVPIVDAKHDVFLSLPEPRQSAYRELDAWLHWYTGRPSQSTSPAPSEKG